MQLWLFLGILAYLLYAISSSIDKRLMDHGFNPAGTNALKMFLNGAILLVVGLLFFDLSFSFGLLGLYLLLGIINATVGVMYFRSLKAREVEVVIPYLQSMTLLLVFLSSVVLFSETANAFNYLGIALILIGVYAVLAEKGFAFPRIDSSIVFLSVLTVLNVVYALLIKTLLFDFEPITLAIIIYLSSAVVQGIYIFRPGGQRKELNVSLRKVLFTSIFGAFGTLLLFSALSIGYASKVYSVAGLQSVFVFVIAASLLKQRFYLHRLLGAVVVFAGIFLISL